MNTCLLESSTTLLMGLFPSRTQYQIWRMKKCIILCKLEVYIDDVYLSENAVQGIINENSSQKASSVTNFI